MPVQLRYLSVIDNQEFLILYESDNEIAFSIKSYSEEYEDIIENIILLSKSDVKHLIKELNKLAKTKDKIFK